MPSGYQPPFTITATILSLAEEIGEALGRLEHTHAASPRLRKKNRIRTVQGSLGIEGNTLSLDQVTAILEGKRVLGSARELQEVRNTIRAYERMPDWNPLAIEDLLSAHLMLMAGLVDDPGTFRTGAVIIRRGDSVVHMPPPAHMVGGQIKDLLHWLKQTELSPLVSGAIFHYEFEFIHPFFDGNGRMGRLWQTMILSRWKPIFAFLPLESVIHDRQEEYYRALGRADQSGEATPFVTFMLEAIRDACNATQLTDQVTDQVSDHVQRLLRTMQDSRTYSIQELMTALGLTHRPTFRKNSLRPALNAGLIEMTSPDTPRSPKQRYVLTDKGLDFHSQSCKVKIQNMNHIKDA